MRKHRIGQGRNPTAQVADEDRAYPDRIVRVPPHGAIRGREHQRAGHRKKFFSTYHTTIRLRAVIGSVYRQAQSAA